MAWGEFNTMQQFQGEASHPDNLYYHGAPACFWVKMSYAPSFAVNATHEVYENIYNNNNNNNTGNNNIKYCMVLKTAKAQIFKITDFFCHYSTTMIEVI